MVDCLFLPGRLIVQAVLPFILILLQPRFSPSSHFSTGLIVILFILGLLLSAAALLVSTILIAAICLSQMWWRASGFSLSASFGSILT